MRLGEPAILGRTPTPPQVIPPHPRLMGCNNSLPVADEFLVPHAAPTNEYGSGLVSKERLVLKVKEKMFSLRGDFTVKGPGDEPFCKVQGTFLSMRQRVVIKDLDGKPIACVLGKILSISPAMFIYGVKPYYEGQQPTSEKEDGLPLSASSDRSVFSREFRLKM